MKKLILTFIICFVCGCASFREGNVGEIQHFPEAKKKHSIYINVSFFHTNETFFANLYREEYEKNMKSVNIDIEKKIRTRFEESNLFLITSNKINTEYLLDIKYETYYDMSMGMYLLNAITFDIFPWFGKSPVVINMNLTKKSTLKQTSLVVNDTLTTWFTLILLPVTPFKFPDVESEKMQNDLIDNLILQTYEKIQSDFD